MEVMKILNVGQYLITLPNQIVKFVYNHDGFHEFKYPVIDLTTKTYKRLLNNDISNIQFHVNGTSYINLNILDTVRWYKPTTLILYTADNNLEWAKNHIITVARRLSNKYLLPLCIGCRHLTMHKRCPAYGTQKYCTEEIFQEIYVQY